MVCGTLVSLRLPLQPESIPMSTPPTAPVPSAHEVWRHVHAHHAEQAGAVETLVAQLVSQIPTAPRAASDEAAGVEAALLLAKMRVEPYAVAAALLSVYPLEVLLPATDERERANDGRTELRSLLEGIARLRAVRFDQLDRDAVESLRKLFLAMAKDVRVVLVALARRVVTMRHLKRDGSSPERCRALARETLDVFAPLANRLGIWQFKSELEDAAFQVLHPDTARELQRLLAERSEQRQTFIDEVVERLKVELAKVGIDARVKGRSKHAYSIYKKMHRKQVDFDQLYDVSAVRVITQHIQDCYAALGIVHSTWTPIRSEFDDYIALPKDNGYQSLHTAVIGPRGRPVEVQIRTQEMHRFAEFGVAAHWAYKEQRRAAQDDRFMLLRQLLDWEKEVVDPAQFADQLKTDIFSDRVFVFTPSGDIIDLPNGATPIDFAYRVHTMVGHRCKGARVNDQIVPLDYRLKTGDRVEVLTHKLPRPSRDWMNPALGYLTTASARGKVKAWFREQGRAEAIAAGKEMVNRELQRLELQVSLADVAREMKINDVDDLYAHVGFGDRRAQQIAAAALQLEKRRLAAPEVPLVPLVAPPPKPPRGVVFDGIDDVMGRRAKCCSPLPGDDVVGFVTRGRGLIIHRRDCTQVAESKEPERIVDVEWGSHPAQTHGVDVEIVAHDRPGVLADVFRLLSHLGAHVSSGETRASSDGLARMKLRLECRSSGHMLQVLERVDHLHDVQEVRRVVSH